MMRQSSSTKGLTIFQRRPVTAPSYVWSWMAPPLIPISRSASGLPAAEPAAAEVSGDAEEPEAGSKGFCAHIHLIGTEIDAGVDFMLAADQVEIVFEGEDIRSTLKWRVAAIAERPIAASGINGNQSLTVGAAGKWGTAG